MYANHKGYRHLARPKQLPPDTHRYFWNLINTRDENTGRRNSGSVSVILPDGSGKVRPYKVDEIDSARFKELSDFFLWFILCGRGFGKSWTGSSWINEGAEVASGEYMGILGRDANDVRQYMIEGDSGILRTARPDFYPKYEPSKMLITWPNGVKCQIYYAEEPKKVRGPNNFRAWVDEPASFKDAHLGLKGPNGEDTAMSNLLMTLRKGKPQLLVTGTPKPLKLIKDLLKYEGAVVVRGSTRENRSNLSDRWMKEMEAQYEGTRLGRQELDGEVLDDNPGALWRREWIEKNRIKELDVHLERIAVAVDPSASSGSESAEAGIIVAGKWWHPLEERYHYYVLEDRSRRGTPKQWAETAIEAYRFHMADVLIAERNNGGEMVEHVIRSVNPNVNCQTVWASRGKTTRAEPISALYEQGRVHHVGDPRRWEELEDQQCTWEPGMDSPDRLDALVWALTELNEDDGQSESDSDGFAEFWRR